MQLKVLDGLQISTATNLFFLQLCKDCLLIVWGIPFLLVFQIVKR